MRRRPNDTARTATSWEALSETCTFPWLGPRTYSQGWCRHSIRPCRVTWAPHMISFGRVADPTHFRNFLNNLKMTRGRRSVFVELQVHHALVYAFNENAHAHGPYEYFRRILGGSYGPELNSLLERVIVFMEEVFRTPVLLSMLILCLANRKEGSSLPTTLIELYWTAMSGALRTAAGLADAGDIPARLEVMQQVAIANMLAERREFTSDDVVTALGSEGMGVWEKLAAADGSIPLIKTLEQKTTSQPAIYQFRHLSFQEALFSKSLLADEGAAEWTGWKDDAAAAKSLKDPSLRNALRIGGGVLAEEAKIMAAPCCIT